MSKAFAFTEAKVAKLEPPAIGRVYHKDSRFLGLQLCVTSAGAKTYYFVKRIGGKPTRVRLGTVDQLTVDQARTAAGSVTGEVAAGHNPQADRKRRREEPSVKDLFDHWMLYANAHKKPRSVAEDQRQYDSFLKTWEYRRLSTIKRATVQALHSRTGRENGIYAANRLLSLLRAMFNKADEIGYRGDNPAKGIKPFKEQSRDRFLHPDELKAFFSALEVESDLFRDFYVTLLLTGARRGNVQAMRWDELDLGTGCWRIPDTKAGMAVVVPLVGPLVTILTARREVSDSLWVFPGRRKGEHLAEPKGAWKRILKRAGLTDLRPHDLRRSLGSWMAGQNVSLTIIGKALGHKTASATMIYSRLSLDPVREAVDRAATAILTGGGQMKMLGLAEPADQKAQVVE